MLRGPSPVRLSVLLLACVAVSAPPAWAQGDDVVRVPSDSPAGAEYSVPLDDARRTGDPEDTGRGAQAPAEPFGRGLGPESAPGQSGGDDAGSPDDPAGGSGDAGQSGATSTTPAATTPLGTTPRPPAASDRVDPTELREQSGGLGAGTLGGLIVLGFGVLIGGVALVRRQQP